jgi:hypothetical protein
LDTGSIVTICYYLMLLIYTMMDLLLIEDEEEELQTEEGGGLPVCSANLTSPVVDTAYYIDEIHYKIGNRLYIENAD